jgi:hypothetical protein
MHLVGVVIPTGERKILGIPEGSNATVETGVFCAKNGIETAQCDGVRFYCTVVSLELLGTF